MTIQGAMNELVNLLNADDIPIYYKGGIKKVIETIDDYIDGKDDYIKRKTEPTISKMEQVDKPQMNPCDGCVCDDGKHLMYCMNCKGIARKTEPPKVEDDAKARRSDMSEIDKMIKMVDGILGDDDLCEGCEYVIEGLSCDECRRKYADKIIKILRDMKHKPQTDCAWR